MGGCPSSAKVTESYMHSYSSRYSSSGGGSSSEERNKKLDFDCINSVAKNPDMDMFVLEVLRFPFTTDIATPTQVEIVSKCLDNILAGKVAKFHTLNSAKGEASSKIDGACMSWFAKQFCSRLYEANPSAMVLYPSNPAAQVKVVRGMITATLYVVSNIPLPTSSTPRHGSETGSGSRIPNGFAHNASRDSSYSFTQGCTRLSRSVRGGLPSPASAADGWRRGAVSNSFNSFRGNLPLDPHGFSGAGTGSDRGNGSLIRNGDSSSPLPVELPPTWEQSDNAEPNSNDAVKGADTKTTESARKSTTEGAQCPFAAIAQQETSGGCPFAVPASSKSNLNSKPGYNDDSSSGASDVAPRSSSVTHNRYSSLSITCETKDSSVSVGNSSNLAERKLYDIAKSHHARKVHVCDYRQMGTTLFETVQHCFGDECTREMRHAWVCVYSTMLRLLMPYVLVFEMETAEKESISFKSSVMYSLNRADKIELDGIRKDKSSSVLGAGAPTNEADDYEAVMRALSREQPPMPTMQLNINRKHTSNPNLSSIHSAGNDSFIQ